MSNKCNFINQLNKKEVCEILSKVFCDFEWNIKNSYGGDTDKKFNMGKYFETATKNFQFRKYSEYVCVIANGHNFELNLYDCRIVAYEHIDYMMSANINKITSKKSVYNKRYIEEMYKKFGEPYKEYYKKHHNDEIKILTIDEQIRY